MPLARAIKVRNKKYYKSNAESIRSQSRENYQNNPQVKRLPCVIEQYIVLIQSPKRQQLVSNIVLIQSPKRQPLVSNIVLIQSPKRQPLVSNIVLIQSPKRQTLVSNIVRLFQAHSTFHCVVMGANAKRGSRTQNEIVASKRELPVKNIKHPRVTTLHYQLALVRLTLERGFPVYENT